MENSKHRRGGKMVAPVAFTLLVMLQVAVMLLVWAVAAIPLAVKIVITVCCLLVIGVAVFVLIERINEIRSGEEDDLSNY